MTNLWNDLDALGRLSHSEQVAEDESRDARPVWGPLNPGAFPPVSEHQEFEIHAVEAPSRLVNGDSFDFFFLSEDMLAVMIADVSGKGMPAALLMGVTRSMVRNLSPVSVSPGDTLTRVNRILFQTNLEAMYVTIYLGWYNIRTGVLQYANAGHPVPYRLDPQGRVSECGTVTGPILGILDIEKYPDREEQIGMGEGLVLYTDGVTEACNPQEEFFGSERFTALLAEHAAEPVRRLCEQVAARVDKFQVDRRQDDATLLALRRKA